MKNKSLYLYTNSYAGIVEAANHISLVDLKIITSNDELIKFCSKLNLNYINIDNPKNTSLKELYKHKTKIKKTLESIKNEDVLFCFYGFDLFGLFVIKILSKENKIFFNNKDNLYIKTSHLRFWKRRISVNNYLIYRFLLNIPLRQFEITDKRTFLGVCYKKLEEKFPSLKSNSKQDLFLHNSVLVKRLMNIKSNSYVIVDAGNYLFTFDKVYFNWIRENLVDGQIYLKSHPNFPMGAYDLKDIVIIEKSIPVELIMDESMTMISVISTALFHNFPFDISKISLINYVKWKDKEEFNKGYERVINEKTIEIINHEK